MEIRAKKISLDELNSLSKNTMLETLGIRITKLEDDFLEGKMPVDHRTHQPFGLLHGGASVGDQDFHRRRKAGLHQSPHDGRASKKQVSG